MERAVAKAQVAVPSCDTRIGTFIVRMGPWGTMLLAAILFVSVARAGDEPVRWNQAFHEAVATADRLVVERDDPESHDTSWQELSAVRGRQAVDEVAGRIHVAEDDRMNGMSCCCEGGVRLVFLRGDERLAVLTVHHGRALRWLEPENPWTGDGHLTRESAVWLSEWLAAHGEPDSIRELRAGLAVDDIRESRWKRYAGLLPASVCAALRETAESHSESRILLGLDEEPAARLARWLRLFGCHEDDWALDCALDYTLEMLLRETPDLPWVALLGDLPDDADLRRGVARALFAVSVLRERLSSESPEVVKGVLPVLVPLGLTQPRVENRRLTMAALVRCWREAALPWMRKILAGEVVGRPDPLASALPSVGRFRGSEYPPELDGVSDRVAAAWFLAKLRDKESLAAIQDLARGTKDLDAEVLATAIRWLSE